MSRIHAGKKLFFAPAAFKDLLNETTMETPICTCDNNVTVAKPVA